MQGTELTIFFLCILSWNSLSFLLLQSSRLVFTRPFPRELCTLFRVLLHLADVTASTSRNIGMEAHTPLVLSLNLKTYSPPRGGV